MSVERGSGPSAATGSSSGREVDSSKRLRTIPPFALFDPPSPPLSPGLFANDYAKGQLTLEKTQRSDRGTSSPYPSNGLSPAFSPLQPSSTVTTMTDYTRDTDESDGQPAWWTFAKLPGSTSASRYLHGLQQAWHDHSTVPHTPRGEDGRNRRATRRSAVDTEVEESRTKTEKNQVEDENVTDLRDRKSSEFPPPARAKAQTHPPTTQSQPQAPRSTPRRSISRGITSVNAHLPGAVPRSERREMYEQYKREYFDAKSVWMREQLERRSSILPDKLRGPLCEEPEDISETDGEPSSQTFAARRLLGSLSKPKLAKAGPGPSTQKARSLPGSRRASIDSNAVPKDARDPQDHLKRYSAAPAMARSRSNDTRALRAEAFHTPHTRQELQPIVSDPQPISRHQLCTDGLPSKVRTSWLGLGFYSAPHTPSRQGAPSFATPEMSREELVEETSPGEKLHPGSGRHPDSSWNDGGGSRRSSGGFQSKLPDHDGRLRTLQPGGSFDPHSYRDSYASDSDRSFASPVSGHRDDVLRGPGRAVSAQRMYVHDLERNDHPWMPQFRMQGRTPPPLSPYSPSRDREGSGYFNDTYSRLDGTGAERDGEARSNRRPSSQRHFPRSHAATQAEKISSRDSRQRQPEPNRAFSSWHQANQQNSDENDDPHEGSRWSQLRKAFVKSQGVSTRKERLERFLLFDVSSAVGLRVFSLACQVAALALAVRSRDRELSTGIRGVMGASPILTIIYAPITIAHTLVAAWKEYNGRPIGLWGMRSKMVWVCLDLLFIALWSSDLSLCISDYTSSSLQCTEYEPWWSGIPRYDLPDSSGIGHTATSLCQLQAAMIAFALLILLNYVLNMVLSLFRIFERIRVIATVFEKGRSHVA